MVQIIDGTDFLNSLIAAQTALGQLPPGSRETWRFPGGEHTLQQGLQLGSVGHSLTIEGADTRLIFTLNGPLAGSGTALTLRGVDISLTGLQVQAEMTGDLIGLQVNGTGQIALRDVRLHDLRGAAVLALDITARTVQVLEMTVSDLQASAGTAGGIRLNGTRAVVSRLHLTRLSGIDRAYGLDATTNTALDASMVRVEEVRAAQAEGVRLRVVGEDGELAVLDMRATQIATPSDGTDAIGVMLLSGGDVDVRSLSVEQVQGARGMGVVIAAVGAVDWLSGDIRGVQGTAAGAAGVRLLASPSAQPITVRDVQIEAVWASVNGANALPPSSWSTWIVGATGALRDGGALPSLPTSLMSEHAEDVVGLHVSARVAEFEPWIEQQDPGPIVVEQCLLRRVSGTALQVEGELRDVEVRGVEAWTAVRGGWVDGERVLLAQLTWHRHHTGLEFGPCALTLVNNLITGVDVGSGVVLSSAMTDLDLVLATFTSRPEFPLQSEPVPLPYIDAGPVGDVPPAVLAGDLAAEASVDLRLQPRHALHREARRVPGDAATEPPFLGAHAPDTDSRCDLRDPLPPALPLQLAPILPSPVVDYRARDARSLLALMLDRARSVMPDWTETNPADMTTMLLELLANRLDHLAYRQENAVAEGFFETAMLRRSVEDHARLVDYVADPGLSATVILRWHIDEAGIDALHLRGRYDTGERLVIPQDTLVVNPDATDAAVIFATEAPLALDYQLATLRLQEAVEATATSAVLAGDLTSLEMGRWLLMQADDPETPVHVMRVTHLELGTDTTRVFWDPRRPAPARYEVETTHIYGNVIPAHHGVPLTPVTSPASAESQDDLAILLPWREQMTMALDNRRGDVREIELPLVPVSVQASGWPLPDTRERQGRPDLVVRVNGEEWRRVEDLSGQGPTTECYVLRAGHGGGAALRFGNGENGAALPRGTVTLALSMRVGLGTIGNVGPHALTRLLTIAGLRALVPSDLPDLEEQLRRHIQVMNPIAATGGRNPEPLERIRYRAPRGVRDSLSAVVPQDYERLLKALPEVAATRAGVVDAGIRRVVRVTMLLKDEDTLTGPSSDPDRDAERLRRWALARQHLESIRLLGFDVELVPPVFVPLDLDIVVDAHPWASADTLALRVQEALAGNGGLFDPDVSGLGGDVYVDALHRRVLSVDGVAAVRVRRLRRLEPRAIEYTDQGVLPVASDEVAVLRHPYGLVAGDGLVTVTVCGGLS